MVSSPSTVFSWVCSHSRSVPKLACMTSPMIASLGCLIGCRKFRAHSR